MPRKIPPYVIIVAASAAQAAATFAAVKLFSKGKRSLKKTRSTSWDTLVDARKKMKWAHESGDNKTASDIAQWIGGGIASLATLTGEDPEELLGQLYSVVPAAAGQVAPQPGEVVKSPDSDARFRAIKRERPAPPPGAPRPIDPADLTPEERAEYGMLLPGEGQGAPLPGAESTLD